MTLESLIDEISENDRIRIEKTDGEISVSIKESNSGFYSRILRIYTDTKSAEFLDIEDEWNELQYALKDKYKEFPELIVLTDYLNQEGYDLVW